MAAWNRAPGDLGAPRPSLLVLSANALPPHVSLVTCAAAPSLFYADWIEPIPADCPRLAALRAELLALPPVARCVEDARPYRAYFPYGAPDRD